VVSVDLLRKRIIAAYNSWNVFQGRKENFMFICINKEREVKKVKVTLVHALRLCTGRTAHKWSRGIALPFMNTALEGVRGQSQAPAALYPGKDRCQ
jgi:hypothetical protein